MTESDFQDEPDEFVTIGVLARASGLTATALRFYDDCGLLPPARVDSSSGYRYYTQGQRQRAVIIRRLREIGMPLDAVAAVLAGDAEAGGRLLDEHVAGLERRAREAAAAVEAIKDALRAESDPHLVVVRGNEFAEAIEQVRPAVARDTAIAVLTGILVESDGDSVVLTATDRYRLTTRSLVPLRAAAHPWSLVVPARDLAALTARLREREQLPISSSAAALVLAGTEIRCPAITESYPDYRRMLTELPSARTRVVVDRDLLREAVEQAGTRTLHCAIDAGALRTSTGPNGPEHRISASVEGIRTTLAFDPTTLSPALRTAVGPEIMLDIAAPDQPVVIRSAAAGGLTTLAMPTRRKDHP
ncbi:DNA polymerase III subunit beta family protein [Nocardia vaccinii]|uniref:DNA polymerase III subunit beta family protein n=1 Tax=Nocardia vaccinii TaxID=1822 RepID=UPI001FE19843|nr:MerR family transcriptional regulator [Nocardia vaccinii]